jgi:hypothetical protein
VLVERRAKKVLGAVPACGNEPEITYWQIQGKLHKRMDQETNGEEHRQWKKTIWAVTRSNARLRGR